MLRCERLWEGGGVVVTTDNSSELGKYHELIKTLLLTYGLLV